MTPKGKAKDLLNKYYGYAHSTHAAKAALLCVDEIIKSWEEDGNKRLDAPVISYWEDVKTGIKEIERELTLHK